MKKKILSLIFVLISFLSFADEGMWLPLLLKQLNEADMKARGMKISADDIYSVNKPGLKDAVVLFGGGCTGEIISANGLLLTNHHCGFSQIQSHSTLENDYLKNGFWAYNQNQELPCPGLSVTFIIRMEDVSSSILKELTPAMTELEREQKIKEVSGKLEKDAVANTHYTATVRSFYNGNQFFLFVLETFRDIRMVGAPPSSIGKFGGDTDNWMWPRHTGDFSLFRVYANKDNAPSEYAADNIPFTPRHFFPVSIKGVNEGDFTMVYGFPGRTTEYIPSFAVKTIVEITDPSRIKIRTARLEIIDAAMRSSDKLRIQYAAKQASIANAWKKWQGELRGLNRLNTIAEKQKEETEFNKWVIANQKKEYTNLLPDFESAYLNYGPLSKVQDYINEAAYGVELLRYAAAFNKLAALSKSKTPDEAAIKTEAEKLLRGSGGFYKDLDATTDKKLFEAMMSLYSKDVDPRYHPVILSEQSKKFKNDYAKWADEYYHKSIFTDSIKLQALLTGYSAKKADKLVNDPMYTLAVSFKNVYSDLLESELVVLNSKINLLNRQYMAAQLEMNPGKKFYPDANSTLRVAFGQVEGYTPRDAVKYLYYTTVSGIMEKEDESVEEFEVPEKLKTLYHQKDFGDYGVNGTMPVAFIASNHTTGGNSGSPVINANGELIGTNFDRVWEGTMSDIDFDPAMCRNISLDIRYTLFVIDKFAGCKRLIDEMKIVR